MERKQAQQKAQLAAQFNDFYLHITSPAVNQIGCYRIIDEIGEGAFGKVYLAMHIILNVKVVLKCGLIDDPNIVREVFYHKQLKHKNIVKLYEVIKTENHLWLVMEYCEGNELFYYIYEKRRLTYDECQRIFSQIVSAISHVHKLNLSHRDLKLENILLADKKKTVVKLTDFGFVREYDPRQRKLLSTVCGTTVYMAPELLKNEKYSGFAADIWALGVILYTMFYGVMPFDEDDDLRTKFKIIHDEPEYKSGVPSEVNLLIQRMLCKDPRQRASLTEVQNSSLLMDHGYHRRSRSSIHTDAGSIVSISQWYNDPGQPFESKVERQLLKRFRKLNIDVDHLKTSVQNRQMNSLTAFYELSLKHEFVKKRYYKEKKKKYNDARMSLRRSRDRFRSALSLSEQGGTQPLERIISSLSIGSNRNNSRTNISKMASPRRSTDSRLDGTKNHYSMSEKLSEAPNRPPSEMDTRNGLNRTVSFYPDAEKQSSKGTGMSVYSEDSNGKRPKNSKILNKLQFWKRNKNPDERSPESQALEQFSNKSDMDDGAITAPPGKIPTINYIDDHADVNSPSPRSGVPPVENLENGNTSLSGTRTYRTRPSSVISQQSQLSHLSQLSTMITESELDMDETEMSDSMDEYAEYDEDGAYESSINASQHELQPNRGSAGSLAPQKRRPSYRRNLSSDMSILSTSTNATGPQSTSQNSVPRLRHHSGHRKRSSMSRLSSNSSDEGSRSKKSDNGSFSRLANTPQVPVASVFRPGTPDLSSNGNTYSGLSFLDINSNGSAPAVARSQSPPLTTRTFAKPKPVKNPDAQAPHVEKHRGTTPAGGYETTFVIIDEEDED